MKSLIGLVGARWQLAEDDKAVPFKKNIASVFTPHCFIQNWVEFKFFRFKLKFVMLGYFRENCRE